MSVADHLSTGGQAIFTNCPDGLDALVIADLAKALAAKTRERAAALLHIARDGPRSAALEAALAFFAPEIEVLSFPAWDCQPYDRVSPNAAIVARRMVTLSRLATTKGGDRPRIVLTTVNAAAAARAGARPDRGRKSLSAAPGNAARMDDLARWLENNGYSRDLDGPRDRRICGARRHSRSFSAGPAASGSARLLRRHARIDPQLRSRNAAHGGTTSHARPRARQRGPAYDRDDQAVPPGLSDANSERRRGATRSTRRSAKAGAIQGSSTGCRCSMAGSIRSSIISPARRSSLDPLAEDAAGERLAQIKDYYDARRDALGKPGQGAPYKPLAPDSALSRAGRLAPTPRRGAAGAILALRPAPRAPGGPWSIAGGGTAAISRPSAPTEDTNVFEAVCGMSATRRREGSASSSPAGRMARAIASAPCSPTTG